MSFTNNVEAIGSSDNTFHTVATGYEASVHALLIDNPSGSSETITIKIKNNVTGTTVNSVVIAVGANSSYIYPRPINLAQQDELILVSTGTAAIGTSSTYTQLMSGVPSAITLTPKGAWASGTTYSTLDIVSYNFGSWIALRGSVGVTPVAGADWTINASRGAAGADGTDGTLQHVVEDTTPELGGNLNLNNKLMIGGLNLARSTVASHPTTADIWTAGNQINWTGTANVTALPNAPQGGVERTLICSAAAVFTAGSNMVIDGINSGDSVTCSAGDQVIVKAISTTSYKLSRIKLDGTAQVSVGGGGMTQAQIQAYI